MTRPHHNLPLPAQTCHTTRAAKRSHRALPQRAVPKPGTYGRPGTLAGFPAAASRVDCLRPGSDPCPHPATDANRVRMTRKMTTAPRPTAPLTLCCLTVLLALAPHPARAAGAGAPSPNERLAAQTLAIFGEKCFECHTAGAKPKPKKFNYIDDLAKLAANPKFIIPGDPEKSVLYEQIVKDEMPPEDAEAAPLSAAQKEVVRAWIAAGAPSGRTMPP